MDCLRNSFTKIFREGGGGKNPSELAHLSVRSRSYPLSLIITGGDMIWRWEA